MWFGSLKKKLIHLNNLKKKCCVDNSSRTFKIIVEKYRLLSKHLTETRIFSRERENNYYESYSMS